VSLLRNEFPSLNVLILGKFFDPAVEREFNEQLNNLNLNAVIYYQSWIPAEKIGLLLKRSRVGLWLFNPQNRRMSRAVPLKVLEYFAAGLPVVSINTPLMRGLIEANELGACCEYHSDSIARSVAGLLRLNPSEYRLLSKRCSNLIDQKFNWEALEPRLLELMRKLASN
ncbi:MAG: glycosyltransferase, partial [Candidatus Cloacimonetes bacterium]|nr:glycosyltransferase [Candidatus Cloacimonadota bacterium]